MSLLEDEPRGVVDLIQASSATTSASMVAGITGPSGVGKSTLTDALITEFRTRNSEQVIGVIAIDPSSPITGGAILGDRVFPFSSPCTPKCLKKPPNSVPHVDCMPAS